MEKALHWLRAAESQLEIILRETVDPGLQRAFRHELDQLRYIAGEIAGQLGKRQPGG